MKRKAAIFKFIEEHEGQFPVTLMIDTIGEVSRSGYYKWKKEKATRPTQEEKDDELLTEMLILYKKHRGTLGNLRFKLALENEFRRIVNHKRIARMRHAYRMPLLTVRRRPVSKTSKEHCIVGNLLNRNFKASRPGIKYCIDISYLEIKKPKKDFLYLCAIKDLYNNEIVSYRIGKYMNLKLVLDTVRGLKEKGPENGAIIHSDQGSQFTSPIYSQELKSLGFVQSMSRRGNCWDNACIESFFGKLKIELPAFSIPETKTEMIQAVSEYISYYNEERPQLKLKMSPVEYRQSNAA